MYEAHQLVAQHLRARAIGTRRTVRDHLPPEAQAFFLRDRHWCVAQAAKVGPACAELVATLLADHVVERLRAAQGVLRLEAAYGPERLDAACRRALDHGSPYYRTVKTLLACRPELLAERTTIGQSPYLGEARFARPARTLFSAAGELELPGGPVVPIRQPQGDHR